MRSLAGRIWSLSLSCTISLDTDGLCNPVKQPSPTPEILLTYTRTHKEQWTTQVAVNILGPVTWIWYISFPSPKTLLRNQQPDRWASFAKRNSWAGSGTARFSYYVIPGYLFIERKLSHFDLDAHAEADAAAACCCCTWLWNWRIWHTSFILVTCKFRTESNIREITSDRFLSAFSSDSWI